MTASMFDFRDLDIMLALSDGGLTSAQLAESLGISKAGAAGSRASWMRKYGMLDLDERNGVWTLSSGGLRVVSAKRKAAALDQVERVPDEAMVDVMSHVTARYRLGDPMMAHMLRREFLFGTSPRSRVWR